MGTDLCPIANHRQNFYEPQKQDRIILQILNGPNYDVDFLSAYKGSSIKKESVEWKANHAFHEDINNRVEFIFEANYYLMLGMYRHTMRLPPRFRYWVLERLNDSKELENFERQRKIWMDITKSMGGDRIIYLADNSHTLERYRNMHGENKTTEEIETKLKQDLGEPVKSIFDLKRDIDNSYYIDRLDNKLG